ncbi:MAG: CmcJ/NvfI family oxidoreductase [Proteobacteria bacterium]|nr:CmcJ/NvfI family oxidoreductase [Pseudomonadota bacterium]
MSKIQFEKLESVEADVNYTEPTQARPAFYLYAADPGEQRDARVSERHSVPIFDIRAQMTNVTLDHNGLCFVQQALPNIDFLNSDTVKSLYYPNCTELVMRATGASRVLAFDHNVRDKELAERDAASRPVRFAPNDYTDKSGPQRVRDLMGDEAAALLKNRYQFINAWRPLRGPVLDTPLAVCDAESLESQDCIATDLKYRDRTGEIYSFQFNAKHRWMFLRNMRADEIILLKCFDSATDGRARYTAHSAFRDPRAPADAEVRRSIDVRPIALFSS